MEVKAWMEKVIIPTYETGKAEKNPIFLDKRVYQGSTGAVYPNPVIEKISDEKTDKEYTAVYIENEFLKIMVLPELGGRIQRAFDKVRNRDFIYYNQVIKPALVGLTGPWISGGIEFNWPQHHRPSTFDGVDFTIEEHADGSKTIWVNELELMTRTKGMAGFTLYPDKAYLEVKGKIYNRTPFPQTFLWWANPAVKVNDHYQSVFPPDVYAVFDHGKRDVSDFPIATGTYYKKDYAPGTDISCYKNIPVPTSYMAIRSDYNFIGGYEHDTEAGMLHVANHHIAPGKKQWTWGNSDFGQSWDRNLTDEDGPYIELMTGVFTDNQPDFSWLQPNEEKTFEQYFMPYAKVGAVKNASKEAMLNVEINQNTVDIKVYATSAYPSAVIKLFLNEVLADTSVFDLSPSSIFEKSISLNTTVRQESISVRVESADHKLLISYEQEETVPKAIPPAATAAKDPADIVSIEELYLNGLHIEQYRHATYVATDYYLEAIKREPSDVRCNNAMGLWYMRRGQFAKAEPFFRRAIKTLTLRNPNPYDGEPYYNLGWSLKMQGKSDEAYEAIYKSTWNAAWQDAGFFALARIASEKGDFEDALYLLDKSLSRNGQAHSVRHLKTAILHKMNRPEEALSFIEASLSIDPFNFGCLYERSVIQLEAGALSASERSAAHFVQQMRQDVHNYIECALDYSHAGLFEEAIALLTVYIREEQGAVYPMVYYYMAWCCLQQGDQERAKGYLGEGQQAIPDFCFPHRIEDVQVLLSAIALNPNDAKAHYYLGNFWFGRQQFPEAIACWEKSVASDPAFPTAHRNLSLAYQNQLKDSDRALVELEKAFSLDVKDARVFMELDQLYKKLGYQPERRLEMFEKYPELVDYRDDLYLEKVTLCNQLSRFQEAKTLLSGRQFHPWEGGEGKVVGQYLLCHTSLAKKALIDGEYQAALELLSATEQYPHNLGEGKLYGAQENDIHYLQGCIYEQMNLGVQAKETFLMATKGPTEPVQAIFYNDPQPDQIFYQGLAWLKLNEAGKAKEIFERFIQFGKQHLNDEIRIDYFAVSLPDLLVFDQDLDLKNYIHCSYLIGLGYLGLGSFEEAKNAFAEVLKMDANHQGAATHLQLFPLLTLKINLSI
ncbi:DUF5107 domain-containing protein [Pedobacter sp. KBW06]|uniref:tetratricopeptide repeat protein n=1 Tax=Pedobacter sp. KBW06 TaxID=2153359 RepID=UPI000F5A4F9F|nr:DUF5107 domain-containing protein [Pedobacter sp. KBW06]RQO69819.1 DUF5107 domain-containing protein [Pedobacter sp. KBW06]